METREAVVIFEEKEIREVIIDGEKWMSAVDVFECLGYKNPSRDMPGFISRNKERLEGMAKLYTLLTKGGPQKKWILNLKGVIMLCMVSHTDKAIPFQRWAVKELEKKLKEMPSEIELKIKRKRILFTDELKEHNINKPHEYINITKSMKQKVGVDKEKKKADCDLIEKMKIAAAEDIARINLLQSPVSGYYEVKPICDKSAESVKIATSIDKPKLIK